MIAFTCAPSIPDTYAPLRGALSEAEIAEAAAWGYVGNIDPGSTVDNRASFGRDGNPPWRDRLFLTWLRYVFENFDRIRQPMGAVEEICLECRGGPLELDRGMPRLASMIAGAAASEPRSDDERLEAKSFLEPYYAQACRLLGSKPQS